MALEQLIAVLEREADAEVEEILGTARGEAAALEAAANERLRGHRAELAAARDADRKTAVALGLVTARREARRFVLEARACLIEQVFEKARARFAERQGSGAYRAALQSLVADALACLGDRPVTLVAHPAIADDIRRAVTGRPGLTVRADAAVGFGFRATADDGSVEVDATLEGRLARMAPQLALEIAHRVDGAT